MSNSLDQNPPSTPLPGESTMWIDLTRLIAVVAIICVGWLTIAIYYNPAASNLANQTAEQYKGISPAIGACYNFGSNFPAIVVAVAVGTTLGISYAFGTFLYKLFRVSSAAERLQFWQAIEFRIKNDTSNSDLREVIAEYREYEKLILDRRNIFWALFARVTLAILVVGLIALLVGTCRVESQAGLPIISGIIAFIIGQGSELVHASVAPIVVSPSKKDRDLDRQPPATRTGQN